MGLQFDFDALRSLGGSIRPKDRQAEQRNRGHQSQSMT
jgi:hypothetical protein